MKRFVIFAAAVLVLTALVSCSSDKEDETVGGDIIVKTDGNSGENSSSFDYMSADLTGMIKLGDYKNISVTKASPILTEEEFENEISALLDNYSYYEKITDRAVEEGDTVVCDYSGYLDGVQFEGGTAQNTEVKVSPDSGYIEGFAEAFVGRMPGEEFSFNATFPESYGNADLAGKEVTFVCTVHSINGDDYITPELTDEFVNETFGYNNAEEFRIAYRTSVEAQKEYYVESEMYSDLWMKIVANAEVLSYPEEEVQRVYGEKKQMYEYYAEYYKTDYETFLANYVGITDDELLEESRAYVKEDLVMYQLTKDLEIEISDAEYNEGLTFYANYYGTTESDLLNYYGEDTIYATILWQKLMETVAPMNSITEE